MTRNTEPDLARRIARCVSRVFTQINQMLDVPITLTELAQSRIYADWFPEIKQHVGQGGAVEQYLFAKLQAEKQKLGDKVGPQWLRTVLSQPAQPELLIPYSVHPSIFSTKADYNEQKTAKEIVAWFRYRSYLPLALKHNPPCIAPVLSNGGHKIVDVASDSGMIPID